MKPGSSRCDCHCGNPVAPLGVQNTSTNNAIYGNYTNKINVLFYQTRPFVFFDNETQRYTGIVICLYFH